MAMAVARTCSLRGGAGAGVVQELRLFPGLAVPSGGKQRLCSFLEAPSLFPASGCGERRLSGSQGGSWLMFPTQWETVGLGSPLALQSLSPKQVISRSMLFSSLPRSSPWQTPFQHVPRDQVTRHGCHRLHRSIEAGWGGPAFCSPNPCPLCPSLHATFVPHDCDFLTQCICTSCYLTPVYQGYCLYPKSSSTCVSGLLGCPQLCSQAITPSGVCLSPRQRPQTNLPPISCPV